MAHHNDPFGDMRHFYSQPERQRNAQLDAVQGQIYSDEDLRAAEADFRRGIHGHAPQLFYGFPSPAGKTITKIITYHLKHGTGHLKSISYRDHPNDRVDMTFYEFVPGTWRFFRPVVKEGKHEWTTELEPEAAKMYKVVPGNEWLTGSQIKEEQCKAAGYVQHSIGHRLFATHGIHREDWMEAHERSQI